MIEKNLSSFSISSVMNRVVSMTYPIYARLPSFVEFCVTHCPACHQPKLFLQPTTHKRAKRAAFLHHFEFCVTRRQPTLLLQPTTYKRAKRVAFPLPFQILRHPPPA